MGAGMTRTHNNVATALMAAAVLALFAGVRLILADRIPDAALSLGLAVALGTSGAMMLLIERRMAHRQPRVPALHQKLRISEIRPSLLRPE